MILLVTPIFHLMVNPWVENLLLCSVASVLSDSVTPWTVARRAPLYEGFSSPEAGCQCPYPGDLLDPGIKPTSSALAGRLFTTEPRGKLWVENESRPISHCSSLVQGFYM